MANKGSIVLCEYKGYILNDVGIQLGTNKTDIKMVLNWSATQSIEGNYSDITATINLICNPVYYDDGSNQNYCFSFRHNNAVLDTYYGKSIDLGKITDLETVLSNEDTVGLRDFQQILIADADTNEGIFTRFSGGYVNSDMSHFGYQPFNYEVVKAQLRVPHRLDGTKTIKLASIASVKVSEEGLYFYSLPNTLYNSLQIHTIVLDAIPRQTDILTATNFTDEENPVITYNAQGNITSLQAAISFDGSSLDIGYRDIPIDSTRYTFNLTNDEREVLRQKAQGSTNVPIYYLVKTVRTSGTESMAFISKAQRILTIVGCNPTLNPTVKDIKPETLALTGNENIFVRYESMVEFSTGATASKQATIVSQSVQCGSKTIYNLYNGVIDDIESRDFIFNATDSRGLHADQVVISNSAMIEYVKPTCKQELEIGISGETGATVSLKASGNYFNGSFGAVNNTLKFEVRYTQNNGSMGQWTTINVSPTYNNGTYSLTTTFGGLNYDQAYTFQSRVTDKLNYVETSQYTIRLLPVFDWSETDFNFNVPVNINAESIDFYDRTVLRHNEVGKNTILSSDGGNIYFRPNGTENTTNETIFYGNGNIKFGGAVNLSSFTINGNTVADYVIATGSASMGSNGTWYWQKWASGKAEAWGCRNFGNMAVTTAWGNLYRSAIFTQDLPSGVFVRTPDSININIVHGGYGGWICKHEQTAPSAVTTGSFIYVRPASATLTPSNLGFHIIGEWK